MKTILPPFRGVGNASAFIDTPATLTALAGALNVRTFTPDKDRPRMGQRPGLELVFDEVIGDGPVQDIKVISKASGVAAYVPDEGSTATGTSKAAGALAGNAWGLRSPTGGMFFSADNANGSPITGTPSSQVGHLVAVHPTGKLAVFGYGFVQTGTTKIGLVFYRTSDMAQVATATITVGGGTGKVVNHLCFSDGALWMAFDGYDAGSGASAYSYSCGYMPITPSAADFSGSFTLTVGTWYPQHHPLPNADPANTNAAGVAPTGKGVALGRFKTGTTEYIYLAAWGRKPGAVMGAFGCIISTSPGGGYGDLPSDRIIYLRSGVWKLEVPANTAGGADATWTQFTPIPTRNDPGHVEISYSLGNGAVSAPINHRSFRFSASLNRKPRGALPTAMAVDPNDGSVVVAFTNQGWACAPSGVVVAATHAPYAGIPYTSLAKISSGGTLAWEVDCDTIMGGDAGGNTNASATTYQTDCPNLNSGFPVSGTGAPTLGSNNLDGPAIRAVAISPTTGDVYAAGRIGANKWAVFKRRGVTGAVLWERRIDDSSAGSSGKGVPMHGIAVDPQDGNPVVVFNRNQTYRDYLPPDEASSADVPFAHILKLNAADGDELWYEDLDPFDTIGSSDRVNATCVACYEGNVLYGTAHAT